MPLLDNLPHRCKIQLRTRTNDALGGTYDVISDVLVDVPCWQQQAGGTEITDFMQQGVRITDKIYFNTDYGITEQNDITVTSRENVEVLEADQITLTVKSFVKPDASVGTGILFRVFAEDRTSYRGAP